MKNERRVIHDWPRSVPTPISIWKWAAGGVAAGGGLKGGREVATHGMRQNKCSIERRNKVINIIK